MVGITGIWTALKLEGLWSLATSATMTGEPHTASFDSFDLQCCRQHNV